MKLTIAIRTTDYEDANPSPAAIGTTATLTKIVTISPTMTLALPIHTNDTVVIPLENRPNMHTDSYTPMADP